MFHIFPNQTTEERRNVILGGSITSTLMLLSVPTLMLGVVQSLVPLIDGLFINNLTNTIVASAVSYSGPLINMMCALAQGLSVAAMAIIGQLNGSGRFAEARRSSTQIVLAGSLLGLLTAPLLVGIAALVCRSIQPQIAPAVFQYLALNALVLPFSFLESIYNGIMNANGKPERPFIRMIIMLVLKVVFDFLFIYILRMSLVGCVLASLAANIIVTVWMFWELFIKRGDSRLELKGFHFDMPGLRQLWRVGMPAMLNSLFLNLGFFLINNEVQHYGPVVLTAQGIANNISSVAFILPGAFSSAVTMLVSMNIGAENPEKARKSCFIGCIWSAVTAVLVIAAIVSTARPLALLFTRDSELLEITVRALHIYTYSVVGFGVCMTIQGAFIGLGRTKVPLVLGLLRIWLLRYLFILATEKYLSYYSVFWGNLFSNYAAAIISIILIARVKWESSIGQIRNKPQNSGPKTLESGDTVIVS